jgi:hypothetical protein
MASLNVSLDFNIEAISSDILNSTDEGGRL